MLSHTPRTFAALFIVAAVTAGCRGEEPEVPPAQAQTQTTQRPNVPTLVTGCLRSGDAANTFVLTTERSVDGSTPATYQLHGSAGVNLADHVGKRIEVEGVLREQTQVATTESRQPADEKAAGVAGTPTVQTGTTVSIRQLDVRAVKSAGGDCQN